MQELLNKYKKPLIFVLVILILIFISILTFPKIISHNKKEIKKLDERNKEIVDEQKKLKEDILKFKEEQEKLDYKLENIKEKTTIIKEYYGEKNKVINSYNQEQLDSFFRNRYKY